MLQLILVHDKPAIAMRFILEILITHTDGAGACLDVRHRRFDSDKCSVVKYTYFGLKIQSSTIFFVGHLKQVIVFLENIMTMQRCELWRWRVSGGILTHLADLVSCSRFGKIKDLVRLLHDHEKHQSDGRTHRYFYMQ